MPKTMTDTVPNSTENAWLWLLKVVSGVLIVVVLILHLFVNHMFAPEGLLSHAEVVAYYQNPLIPIMEGFFLIFVVLHSLLGVRSILLDLRPSRAWLRAADVVLILVGITAIAYGLWILRAVVAHGNLP